ncbi:TIGR04283 family arsenosugar biosynthesis glycosyltransferase [Synechococcus sp. L2F]|jgi:rSAM/selenodomain-associated transferase 2|uniref:TIGR04283 family arsenosugar biosynthesis glycosyltransferase n=1 Tax=Synechococcus sp. L2F TaxID=2823739 RepID=UPI0020CDA3AE|nr:TIGR04283 family arsenosugar biosynthesis glycosyltransferase [Synechococcus sp. L2F]MCP9829380.1 TIGR04283 family arsenosugar biosynthesis glycosyltransferase [Synechococcus sp. L2F]
MAQLTAAAPPGGIAVVIPVRNEAAHLPLLLADLSLAPPGLISELLVVDGGSSDGSGRLARLAGAALRQAAGGRGAQLVAGVAATEAPWLLLLHGDLRLPPRWWESVRTALGQAEAAWYFRLRVQEPGLALRLMEAAVELRSRWACTPYGDQGLLLPRRLLERAGGLRPLPLMEDLDLVLRLRRWAPVRCLGPVVWVEGRRWRRLGVWRTTWHNARLRRAWRHGTEAGELARRYYQL